MLLQVLHKGRAAGANVGWVPRCRRRLAIDIRRGVLEVQRAEGAKHIDGTVARRNEPRWRVLAECNDAAERGWTRLKRFKQSDMLGWHIATHLHEVGAQLIGCMLNAEHGVKARHDGALRTRFAAERLRLAGVGGYPFVHQATWQGRVVVPAEDVRTHAVVVDIRIARFRHALHGRQDAVECIAKVAQRNGGAGVVAR